MRVIVQRSKESSVVVDNNTVGSINKGMVILVGFNVSDTIDDVNYIVNKVLNLRIFDDENGVMNLSVKDKKGEILSISQFTLYGDITNGNRPSYQEAMKGDKAIELYAFFNNKLREHLKVEEGIFGADMILNIQNDGPVTIIIDSKQKIANN